MTIVLIVIGLVLIVPGVLIYYEVSKPFGVTVVLFAVAFLAVGTYEVSQEETQEKQECLARGGEFVDLTREKDICVAPGTLR